MGPGKPSITVGASLRSRTVGLARTRRATLDLGFAFLLVFLFGFALALVLVLTLALVPRLVLVLFFLGLIVFLGAIAPLPSKVGG
jgi:uncharacterized membrane protein (Fun14 family)